MRLQKFMRLGFALCVLCPSVIAAERSDYRQEAERILNAADLPGGLIVNSGCGNGELAAGLGGNGKYLVHALDTDAATIKQARSHIQSLGLYGRVSVYRFDESRLPYADNLVNLVVSEDLGTVEIEEVMRVLCPNGIAYVKTDGRWTKTAKSWPDNIDQWTHYLHGPDGNPVANDSVVGPPKRYQWLGGPLWMRSHESDSSVKALVTAKGKIFYIVDEGPTSLLGPHRLPDKWFLAARDAFNGIELWKVPMKDWGWQSWKPSWFTPRPGGIPLNLPKCLVAVEDKVYVTLGYRAQVSQLDARTGETIRTYKGTDRTAEILHLGDSLILTLITDAGARAAKLNTETGKIGWKTGKDYGGTTTDYYRFSAAHGRVPAAEVDPTLNTATDGNIVSLLDRDSVVALDYETGKELWRTKFPLVKADFKAGNINAGKTLWTGTLIVKDGVVIHASPNQLAAFDAAGGTILWSQPKKYLQHLWFEWKDVFVIDGLVWTWSAELQREKLEGGKGASVWPATVNGYDLRTGKLTKQIPLGKVFKTHHHHRCYRNKATVNYILASRRGTEYIDLKNAQHSVHNWVRGICHLGMMPANGLQYAPPHPCVCYSDEKLNGFNALAPDVPGRDASQPSHPLEKGPAFDTPAGPAATAEDWPAFRADSARSGSTTTKVPSKLKSLWNRPTDGKLAPPIVVGDTLFVPQPDTHRMLAISAKDGKTKWQFTVGSRIDSPPTYHRGKLLFGSADGWVYCIAAETGSLIWRFRAAPHERLISAFGRLESAWPVHGAILIHDNTAYFAAGRSSQLDGGIYLFGLDPETGKQLCRRHLDGPDYNVDNIEQNYLLPMGSLPDVMQAVDGTIYMRQMALDKNLQEQKPLRRAAGNVIHAEAGMLDDAYFKRTPWTLGGMNSSYARLIVHDAEAAYSIRMFDSLQGLDPKVYFTPADKGYLLFATNKSTGKRIWERRIPIRVNAMVATADVLFVAGYPDTVDPDDPLASFEGRAGGILLACNKITGKELFKSKLAAPPVFNGIAAANGRLYIAMQNARIVAFGE